jgi:phosphatidylglycerol:prolipoprotein diacylglycerol transferase
MGQWLTVPMIAAGIYLIVAAWRAGSRNQQGKSVKSEPAIMPKSSCSE